MHQAILPTLFCFLVPIKCSYLVPKMQCGPRSVPARSAFHLKRLSLLHFASTPCILAGEECFFSLSLWSPEIGHSIMCHDVIIRARVFLVVLWEENAFFLFSPTFLPLWGEGTWKQNLHKINTTRQLRMLGFLNFVLPPFFFFFKKLTGEQEYGTHVHLNYFWKPVAQTIITTVGVTLGIRQRLSHVIHIPTGQLSLGGTPPPKISWCPLTFLSPVSKSVFHNGLFFVSPDKTLNIAFQSTRPEVASCVQKIEETVFSELKIIQTVTWLEVVPRWRWHANTCKLRIWNPVESTA